LRLWRISNYPGLRGIGGALFSGRWHSKPRPIVYLADSPSSALLEILVHLDVDPDNLPDAYQLIAVDVPDDVQVTDLSKRIAPGWSGNEKYSRARGNRWLDNARAPLARVPSAIMPFTFNYLLNPQHPEAAKLKIDGWYKVPYDPRLL
jgi:RES domain-containing protein